ncbi:MAG: hypothetical protein IJR85_09815 [Synergistaceae bacterium]|nr:hypothetical protein [Synergistaceae bacterium]
MDIQELTAQIEEFRVVLEHKAEELRLQELLKDIDAKRADWERRTALFVPSKQRLERGGRALELGEAYETIKDLRIQRDKWRIRQGSLRDDLAEARTNLQNAEEALTLIEAEYRTKLTEQAKLETLAQKVKALDAQAEDRQEAAAAVNAEFVEAERKLKECSARVETEQKALEKIEVALREARKFLQLHASDEKLASGLSGIQKCFTMYSQAEEKRVALKESWGKSIQKKQQAQSVLNDRAAMLSDVMQRFSAAEKNYVRARSFFESTLKGKSIVEWHEICDRSIKRLAELDELYKKYQELASLEGRLKNLQEAKLRIQQEARSLNIRDVEQSGKILEMQEDVAKLEKRVALLRRIEDLDAVRELLQDNTPCPLCGAMTHPYTSGAIVPDPEEIHAQLAEAQKRLDELRDELTERQARTGKLNSEAASIGLNEAVLREQINTLNAEISSRVSTLGIRMGAGISPFEELDRSRQKTRDQLQLSRNAADTAEAAERDMKAAADELEKIRETRTEVSRFHQDALFALQSEKSEEERFSSEGKTQEEIVNSLKRELISQIMPYGYKTLPDKNPGEVVKILAARLEAWQEGSRKCDELERELSVAHTRMTALKKERELMRQKREELASRTKTTESERDSVKQQRIILFESRDPDSELARVAKDVEALRAQLNERRENRNDKAAELDRVQTSVHTLETEMATGREELQKHEIAFSKKLLALGFRNEDDYAAALLTPEERRDLQGKLRELNQTDFDLTTERENAKARLLELGAEKLSIPSDKLNARAQELKNGLISVQAQAVNDADEAIFREKLRGEIIPAVKELMLTCGLEEVF